MGVIALAAQQNTPPRSSQNLTHCIRLHGRNYIFYFYFLNCGNLIFYFIA